MAERTIRSKEEMDIVAEEILSILPQKPSAQVVGLSGELGAGKTTFVQAVAQRLGIKEHVTSPTFVIMKRYEVPEQQLFSTLVHIDVYRIEDIEEMRVLDLPKIFNAKDTLVCIEWPERIQELLPKDILSVKIEITGEETRKILYGS